QQQIVKNAAALAAALLGHGYRLVTGGTDTHLMLLDLTPRNITGKDAQEALDRAWITVNKNTVPFETKSPMVTSGIRIGTPAVTTRGMREAEMVEIARLIDHVLANLGSSSVEAKVRGEVQELRMRSPFASERTGCPNGHGEGGEPDEVPVLRSHGGAGRRLAGGRGRGVHPAPPRVPKVPPPVYDLRVHRGRAAARGQ